MAYKALYRTYRPDNFEDMAGQKHIVKTLNNAIERNQIAHAYLFCGPRGTGKTSSAKIFAKAINCEAHGSEPCGVCDNCIAASNGTHPDIIEIDAASNNGVEEARNLIEKVKYAPSLGKYKVYIIDEVHMMSTGAFNALLKTIEEPPAHVIFILATTEPYKVIPTIISRCQRFDFTKITRVDIVKALDKIITKENIQVEDKVLDNIAILADGGMRDALSILDQCHAYAPDKITLQDVSDIYGVVSTQEVCDIIEYIKAKDIKVLMNKVEQLEQNGADIKRLTMDLIEVLKESIVYDYAKDTSLLSLLTNTQVEKIKEYTNTENRLDMINVLMNTYDKYRQASNVISYFEIALLKMMEISYSESIKKETIAHEIVNESKPESDPVIDQVEETIVKKDDDAEIEDDFDLESEEIIETVDDVLMPNENSILEAPQEIIEEKEEVISSQEDVEEIIVEQKDEQKEKCLSTQYIVRLLVGANKPEKFADAEKMKDVDLYALELNYAKYANLLKHCNIVASGDQYIVLCVETMAKANEINELDENSEFLSFTLELFKKKKKVFALVPEQRDEAIDKFVTCQKENNLPEPLQFKFNETKERSEEDEQIETMKSLFSELEIKED